MDEHYPDAAFRRTVRGQRASACFVEAEYESAFDACGRAFWAARIVAKFSNEAIGVIVDRAHYSDPRAADYVTGTLVKRRDKVLAYWLTQVNPLVDFALTPSGELTFANAAEQAGVATAASAYRVQWASFDNTTGAATNVGGEATVTGRRAQAPQALVDGGGTPGFIEIRVAAEHPQFPEWNKPVTLHFKRGGKEWKLVARQAP